MKRFVLLILGLILYAGAAKAQDTTVTASVIDTDGTIWANGTWKAEFVPNPSNPNINQYYLNGVKLYPTYSSSLSQSGSLNGGTVTINTLDNSQITPKGSMWKFTFCPMASSACGSLVIPTTGSTYTIPTSSITAAIPAPRFAAVQGTYGYADVEAQVQITPGSTYYNVISSCYRTYSPSTQTWQCGINTGILHNSTWISVAEYNAVGNCTTSGSTSSCTDNTAAIQAAINYCYTNYCAVYFPAAYGSTYTVYYVASPINPKGVSLFGPPGASGSASNGIPSVGVRGGVGNDVFAIGDPSSSGYVKPLSRWSIRDLAIIVDNSIDASSSGTNSFPNRYPGRTVYDGSMSSSSAVLTSAGTAYFQPGDVGQAIVVYGAGSSLCYVGGPSTCLVTTVSSWQSATQVTLSATSSANVSSDEVYISVAGLSGTQTVGNAAFSMDAASYDTGGENPVGSTDSDITNVYIRMTNLSQTNQYYNQVGLFFQGAAAPYGLRIDHSFIGTDFGILGVPANLVTTPGTICAGWCDFNVVEHTWLNNIYPWITYGGGEGRIQDVQLSDINQGPNILAASADSPYPISWSIDNPEEEANWASGHTCGTGWTAWRVAGTGHTVTHMATPYCTAPSSIAFQWDANYSNVTGLTYDTMGNVEISGSMNTFRSTLGTMANGFNYSLWSVTGAGNVWITCGSENQALARCQYTGLAPTNVGPAMLSRGSVAFNRTADFIDKGAGAYFLNREDLWVWPTEFWSNAGAIPTWTVDSTNTEIGASVTLPTSTTTNYTMDGEDGTAWSVGSQIPATDIRVYFYMKASGSQAFPLDVVYGTSGGTPTTSLGCSLDPTLTTTWTLYSCDVNASSVTAGSSFGVHLGSGSTTPTYAVSIGWIGLQPWSAATLSTSLQVGFGSTAMTTSSGNGTSIQHTTTATKVSGDIVVYDTTGNATDSGTALSSLTSFNTVVPAWLQNLGSGADGAETCNTTLTGDYYYTTFSVPLGDTCTIGGGAGLTIHATGACTINGTIIGQGQNFGIGGGAAGGSGGGTAAAATSASTYFNTGETVGRTVSSAGTAGGASGGSGGAAGAVSTASQRALYNGGAGLDGQYFGGSSSSAGGSSGGAAAGGGGSLILICGSITGTGTINLSGANGNNAAANNTGASAGGGGGVGILSSQTTETFGLTVNVAAGSAGSCGAYTGCGTPGTSAAGWYTEISGW